MTSDSGDELLEFPCEFPLKIMGRALPGFDTHVRAIVDRHVPTEDQLAFVPRASKQGRYLSVTVTIRAASRDQLDDLYRALSADERILVVL